jgi:uncharacterized protein (DUF4415 family)
VARPPFRRSTDPFAVAEAAFKAATTKPAAPAPAAPKPAAIPGVKEQVTLRLDQEVLHRFQEEGPGWQDRMNAALRKALGLDA